jgi:hypothetical protein
MSPAIGIICGVYSADLRESPHGAGRQVLMGTSKNLSFKNTYLYKSMSYIRIGSNFRGF